MNNTFRQLPLAALCATAVALITVLPGHAQATKAPAMKTHAATKKAKSAKKVSKTHATTHAGHMAKKSSK